MSAKRLTNPRVLTFQPAPPRRDRLPPIERLDVTRDAVMARFVRRLADLDNEQLQIAELLVALLQRDNRRAGEPGSAR